MYALQNQWLELDKVDSQLITKNIAKAAMKKKENFDKLEDKFKNDPDIILEALRYEDTWGDSEIFNKMNESLKTNKEFLVKAVNIKESIFDQISDDLKKDKDLTLEEVKYSINFIDQLELPKSKRDKKLYLDIDFSILILNFHTYRLNFL